MPNDSNQADSRQTDKGATLPAQGGAKDGAPRTPNEHDESADSQAGQEPSARRVGRQGQQDLERGRVDTGTGPALDATYDKLRGNGAA